MSDNGEGDAEAPVADGAGVEARPEAAYEDQEERRKVAASNDDGDGKGSEGGVGALTVDGGRVGPTQLSLSEPLDAALSVPKGFAAATACEDNNNQKKKLAALATGDGDEGPR